MEIEAKYSVLDPETAKALMLLTHIAGYQIQPERTRRVRDIYLDTSDQRLMAAGYACRCRDDGSGSCIQLKELGLNDGTVHRREEAAGVIDASTHLIPVAWPDMPVRDLVQRLRGDQPLSVLFELQQTRRIRIFMHPERGEIAELSLDDVSFQTERWQQNVTELEIELLAAGTEDDLSEIMTALNAWRGLVPQPTSKFERGMELAHRHRQTGEPFDLDHVQEADTFGEATRKLIRPLFLRMQRHEPGTYMGDDPEELHDMRVMTRRMRTAFRIAEPYLVGKKIAGIRKGLRKTARLLGDVRDMDVFRQKTQTIAVAAGVPTEDLWQLAEVWNTSYARARNALLTHLDSPKYGRWKQAFWSMLATHLPEADPLQPVLEGVQCIIAGQLDKLLAQGAAIERPRAALSAYHQLRIDVKQLRYTLSFFQDLLGPETKAALRALEALQDHFGDLQDATVAVNHLRAVAEHGTWEPPLQAHSLWREHAIHRPTDGLLTVLEKREAEMDALIAAAGKTWYAFKEEEGPAQIQKALSALQRVAVKAGDSAELGQMIQW
jgi:triphosphatase